MWAGSSVIQNYNLFSNQGMHYIDSMFTDNQALSTQNMDWVQDPFLHYFHGTGSKRKHDTSECVPPKRGCDYQLGLSDHSYVYPQNQIDNDVYMSEPSLKQQNPNFSMALIKYHSAESDPNRYALVPYRKS
ncbi:hypothetical protein RF11_15799 [Thelohanellus kitauei]|uniref:Uncharacterized protein n=1 Tax=Thelohanellus kitauei TaxID=669202 RepID=A0A0C2MFN6_THEKT|nr:hypothetical protein RF11_15799 [Thelohanellus kitauei]